MQKHYPIGFACHRSVYTYVEARIHLVLLRYSRKDALYSRALRPFFCRPTEHGVALRIERLRQEQLYQDGYPL